MESQTPKVPREAVQLYDEFIHGHINRRAFLDGVTKYAVGGLAATTIVELLMPNYAAGQQVPPTEVRPSGANAMKLATATRRAMSSMCGFRPRFS